MRNPRLHPFRLELVERRRSTRKTSRHSLARNAAAAGRDERGSLEGKFVNKSGKRKGYYPGDKAYGASTTGRRWDPITDYTKGAHSKHPENYGLAPGGNSDKIIQTRTKGVSDWEDDPARKLVKRVRYWLEAATKGTSRGKTFAEVRRFVEKKITKDPDAMLHLHAEMKREADDMKRGGRFVKWGKEGKRPAFHEEGGRWKAIPRVKKYSPQKGREIWVMPDFDGVVG